MKNFQHKKSTRSLLGIERLTDCGAATADGELLFYLVEPDNLSLMTEEEILGRVKALQNLFSRMESVRVLATDSRESFAQNKAWYRERLERETLPAVRELLRRDMAHLDAAQSSTASAREFLIVCKGEQSQKNLLEKSIRDCGFRVRSARRQDVKRVLAVYYHRETTAEVFPDFDGEGVIADEEESSEEDKDGEEDE